jgi:uncharacterized protein DUF1203
MPGIAFRPLPAPLPELEPLPASARTVVVDEMNAYPCRRCLRDAEPGERVVLLSYDPFVGNSATPYRQPGPIYVHEYGCAYVASDETPDQLASRVLSVRSFGRDDFMLGGVVIQGSELQETADRLLADDTVAYVHVHNAGPGCFAVRIDRTD